MLVIQQNVPMCPKCSALMNKRYQDGHLYLFCNDCRSIFKVIGTGKAEIELLVDDEVTEYDEC